MKISSWLMSSVVVLGAGLAGCAHKQVTAPAPADAPVAVAPPPQAKPAPEPAAPSRAEQDLAALLSGTVIHFGFDDAMLTSESRDRLQRLAEALKVHPDATLRISGNCDERGTEEYNLALGQKRADVARKYLVDLGVASSRIATVSYGDERPADPRHSQDAWTTNRRDEFSNTRGD